MRFFGQSTVLFNVIIGRCLSVFQSCLHSLIHSAVVYILNSNTSKRWYAITVDQIHCFAYMLINKYKQVRVSIWKTFKKFADIWSERHSCNGTDAENLTTSLGKSIWINVSTEISADKLVLL